MLNKNLLEKINFYKMSGTQNTFLIWNLIGQSQVKNTELLNKLLENQSQLAKALCQTPLGTGSDGFIILQDSNTLNTIKWNFFNADGSSAEMCGNASRCVGRFYFDKINPNVTEINLETISGLISIKSEQKNQFIHVQMSQLKDLKWNQKLDISGIGEVYFDQINSGVPHIVIESIFVDNTNEIYELSKILRNHSLFLPKGTNVTFLSKLNSETVKAVTFERGVENFTKSCGTGAVAAAASFFKNHSPSTKTIKVIMPGGELMVNLEKSEPLLISTAEYICEVNFTFEQIFWLLSHS